MELLGGILVNAFSRNESLRNCLESIVDSNLNDDFPLIVVFQVGHSEVEKVIQQFRSSITLLVEVPGNYSTPLENINMNRILGYQIAFDHLKLDWLLGVEEDAVLSPDAITFVKFTNEMYFHNFYFRGVNLGSFHPHKPELYEQFGKIRFGLHGQAGSITRKTWDHFNLKKLIKNSKNIALDAQMEFYLRTGFMATPIISRFVDTGWDGTHMPKDPEDQYFHRLRESFGPGVPKIDLKYKLTFQKPSWREDAKVFSPLKTPLDVLNIIKNRLINSIRKRFII